MFFIYLVPAAIFILAILLGLTLATPSWHWVIAVMVVIGAWLIYLWVSHWIAAAAPGYKEGPGGGLGIMIVGVWSWAFALASTVYVGALIWWHNRDGSREAGRDGS